MANLLGNKYFKVKVLIVLLSLFFIIFFVYKFFNKEVIIIYPDYLDAKIKPNKNNNKNEDNKVYSIIKSINKDVYSNVSISKDPEEPINIKELHYEMQQAGITDSKKDSNILEEFDDVETDLNVKENIKHYRYSLHLGSTKVKQECNKLWVQIKQDYPKIFEELVYDIKLVKNQDKMYYVLIAKGYDNINKAKNTCNKLLKSNHTCIIIDNFDKLSY